MRPDPLSPARDQVASGVAVVEDAGCLVDGAERVFAHTLEKLDASTCRGALPAATLRAGHAYYWYVTPRNAAGHAAFAPSEGCFTVTEGE